MRRFYAHSTENSDKSDWQTLEDHLQGVADLAEQFAAIFGVGNLERLAGLLHDLGKYTSIFQNYLERSFKGEDVTRGEVVHSLQGARFVEEKINDNMISDIIGNVIASHHGGLFDNITDGERTLLVSVWPKSIISLAPQCFYMNWWARRFLISAYYFMEQVSF